MKTIVILTEDASNLSVNLIQKKIATQCLEKQIPLNVLVLEKKEGDDLIVDISNNALVKRRTGFFQEIVISLQNIAWLMVRTWTDKREPVIELSKILEQSGVPVFDSKLHEWTLSKIEQYRHLSSRFFPISLCLDGQWISECSLEHKNRMISDVLIRAGVIGYPLVIKNSRGSRGTGVYRVHDENALNQFLCDYLSDVINTPSKIKGSGLILQRHILPPNCPPNRSKYLRVNVVNQEISSVVQFELGWKPVVIQETLRLYEKIDDSIPDADDMPVELDDSLQRWYGELASKLPFVLGIVGLDVIQDEEGKLYFLEANCGPNVSLIESLGKKYSDTDAGKKCSSFSAHIAEFSIQQALAICRKNSHEKDSIMCINDLTPI
ncbi:ATP-grasp domain-containing protein [Legionella feeleii]|uniref:Glutathione synthase/Ribosomal protein S6 modification enzyme (Glutaminyl transferase) n=1 Tax=Legionella feeleii TaxID=453 RepID=A0A378KJ49_9GAMM|nr:hypothetical protein [Legionella feeleii]STX88237.1 Glutathione synthase/Ribosomal protein S6 modification enzyme (glutaminyl transferase) [Legionella feeleii]